MTIELTNFFAIWGAILGTVGTVLSIALAVREFKKDHYKFRVTFDFSDHDPCWLTPDNHTENYVVANVLNIGFRPVQIRSVYLNIDKNRLWHGIGRIEKDVLPKTLAEGQYIDMYFRVTDIRNGLSEIATPKIKLIAYIEDGKGKKHKHIIDELVTGEIKRLG